MLQALVKAKTALSRHQIILALAADDQHYEEQHIAVELAKLCKVGLAVNEGKVDCECCGHPRSMYRITEDALIMLNAAVWGRETA